MATMATFRERAHGQRNFGMHLVPEEGACRVQCSLAIGDSVEVLEVDEARHASSARERKGGGKFSSVVDLRR